MRRAMHPDYTGETRAARAERMHRPVRLAMLDEPMDSLTGTAATGPGIVSRPLWTGMAS